MQHEPLEESTLFYDIGFGFVIFAIIFGVPILKAMGM